MTIIARRQFMTLGTATLIMPALGITHGFAGGGREPETGSGTRLISNNLSQDDFARLSHRQFQELYTYPSEMRKIRVAGFSAEMAYRLVQMGYTYRRRTIRLMRDLSRLNNTQARRARLREELDWAEEQYENLDQAYDRALEKNLGSGAVNETLQRRARAQIYRDHLRTWFEHPHEGAR